MNSIILIVQNGQFRYPFSIVSRSNDSSSKTGMSKLNTLASYIHIHFLSNPVIPINFIKKLWEMQSFTMKREIVMETKNFVIIGNTQTAIENHISKALKLRFKTDDIIFFQNISDKSGFNEYIHQCIKKSCDKLYVMIVPWCEDYADIEKGIKKIFSDIKKNNNIYLECTLIDSDSVIFNIADIIESGFFKSTLLHSKYVDSDANEIRKISHLSKSQSRFNDNPVEKSIMQESSIHSRFSLT